MDWTTPVATVGGAAIALIGTVLADVLRTRGHRERDNRAERRQSYVDFLLALNAAHANLRGVAAIGLPEPERLDATRRALDDAQVYEGREQLLMTANKPVVVDAEKAFQRLLRIRDAIRGGARLRSTAYHGPYHEYAGALWRLRRTIRHDLGASYLAPSDLDREAWDGRPSCDLCRAEEMSVTAPLPG